MRSLLLSIALLIMPGMASAQSHFTRINPPGPHAVGLRVVEQYDKSRGYRGATDPFTGKPTEGERARPVQTLIWYPADKATGRATSAGDYMRLGGTSDSFPAQAAERARLEARYVQSRTGTLPPDRAKAELSAPMLAKRDATASSGKFPVIIYAPSYRAPAFENADLAEFLASQGYIVIASPSTGQSMEGMNDDLEGVQTQMGDIQFLIGFAHLLPNADTERLAVIGYSWGGLANVMAAAKDSRIDALVSLDGSVRSYPDVIEQSRFLTPDRITVPMLYVAATPRHLEDLPSDMNAERSFLNKMKYADLYRVTLAPYVHSNFSVMGQRFLPDGAYGDYDKDELSVANAWLETYVRRFLDGYLKDDAAARAFLELPASQTEAPAHLFTLYRTKAQGAPPSRAAFAAELARRGFQQASAIYGAWRKRDPGFALSERDLNSWGYALLGDGEVEGAVAILRLAAELHPDSWNAFDSLGEAYARAGMKAPAIEAYRKSLSLNPANRGAIDQLARLGVKP
ncbi:CocE/NonD family hydrolase [Sphingomonas soli]|uniref:CocE/NonD family hydrolase n=1 Tax=Sphingomonas soli TaxID=266127 RepID=UPI0008303BE4|nr:CocE/NonD family hydrolase [Sphingomonas soli]